MVKITNEGLSKFMERIEGLEGVKDPKALYHIVMSKMYKLKNMNVSDFGPFLSLFSKYELNSVVPYDRTDIERKKAKAVLRELHARLIAPPPKPLVIQTNTNTAKRVIRRPLNNNSKITFGGPMLSRRGSFADPRVPSRRSSVVSNNNYDPIGVVEGGRRRHRKTRKHSRRMKRRHTRKH